jgi:hypothetical protein
MGQREPGPDCWPTHTETLLLRASLLDGDDASSAWEQWHATVDLERLDRPSHRMLPLLSRNLDRIGVRDSALAKLRGVRRQTWYKNQFRLRELAYLLERFNEAGLPTMVLKGAALTSLYYRDISVRPMNDFDLMVKIEQRQAALKLMRNLGWKPKFISYLEGFHAACFANARGQTADLHWHALEHCCEAGADDDFWAAAVTIDIGNVRVCALSPTDNLLHICAHAARAGGELALRWAADAMAIIRGAGDQIDWDRMVRQAQKRHLVLQVAGALGFLKENLAAPVPPEVIARLNALPVSWSDRVEYRLIIRPYGLWTAPGRLWFRHRRFNPEHGFTYSWLKYPGYLWRCAIVRFSLMLTYRRFTGSRLANRLQSGMLDRSPR